MNPTTFLLLNLALAFFNTGTIWAHEVDIFRSWRLVEPASFHRVQNAHWRKLLGGGQSSTKSRCRSIGTPAKPTFG